MKVIGICGSPREASNTRFYLERVLDELKSLGSETELLLLKDLNIRSCKGCYGCVEAKKCVIEDDFGQIFEKMVKADGILFGSPVYHGSITSELKCLLDRAGFSGRWYSNDMKEEGTSYSWGGTAFSGKVVAPVTVARRAGHNFAFAQVLLWATANDCIVAGSNYWNVGVAGKGGAVNADKDEEGIGIMKHLAGNIYRIIKCLHNGAI
jgi:multimeric flavodoxin WrbA